MKKRLKTILFVSFIFVLIIVWKFLLPPITIQDSLAPGCKVMMGGFYMGGCFGKSIIKDFSMKPPVECLKIEVNNCNGGVIAIQNNCNEIASIGEWIFQQREEEASYSERVNIELFRNEEGSVKVREAEGNFGRYLPSENDILFIEGKIGDQNISISYTKTKKLCE